MGSFPGSVFPFVSHKVVGSYAHNSGGNPFPLPLSDCPDTNCRYFFVVPRVVKSTKVAHCWRKIATILVTVSAGYSA